MPSPLRTDSVLPLDKPEAAAPGLDESEEPPPPTEEAAFLRRTLRRKLEMGSLVLYSRVVQQDLTFYQLLKDHVVFKCWIGVKVNIIPENIF